MSDFDTQVQCEEIFIESSVFGNLTRKEYEEVCEMLEKEYEQLKSKNSN